MNAPRSIVIVHCQMIPRLCDTNTQDKLTKAAHNTTDDDVCDVEYNFAFDGAGRPTTVKVGSQTLSTTVYNPDGTVQKVTYGNSSAGSPQEARYTYDDFKRLQSVQFDGETGDAYTYEYGANGQVMRLTDTILDRRMMSEYDTANRPMRITHMEGESTHLYTGQVEYDEYNNLKTFKEQVGTARTPYQTDFTYDNENKPTLMTFGDTNNKVAYAYDAIGRVSSRTVTAAGHAYATAYGYATGNNGSGNTTTLISSLTQTGENFTYTYDDVGNIASVVQNNKTTAYTYDALGQLTRVDDPSDTTSGSAGTTWVYDYDRGGNILSKKRYAYTTGSLGTVLQTISYTYGDSNWKDKMTAYNGTGISYDAIGNPIYDGTWSYTWEKGRQLKQMSKSGTTAAFLYNADGLRIRKTVNGVVTNYTLHGKNIVHLTQGSNALHFWYDALNRPAIVQFNGTKYAYIHNLQGDIVGILDGSGTEVVKYTYDVWGKVLSTTGSLASTLGTIQPFRYRGYVYDVETGLYYVSSRYYDPELCRFINADDASYLGANGDFISYNLFAYCGNNPVTGYDPDGTLDWGNLFKGSSWLAVGVTAIAVGVSVLTCGVAAPAMMAVAAVTVVAGAATAVNGVSELGEAATGHNFMRDDVFRGDATAYNTYAHATAAVAEIGTMVCGGWLKANAPRINAYKSMDTYNVKGKHLSSGNGNWSKFNTTSQAELRTLGKEAIKNSPMGSLYPNSEDSYRLIYEFGRVIGTSGETSARLIFSNAGKIITFFPQ